MQRKPRRRNIRYMRVTDLLLDNMNPRLPPGAEKWDQDRILMEMEKGFDLLPVAQSMSDNGYFPEEPLIVIPSQDKGKYIVVEGNRRLAALRMLTDPEVRVRSLYRHVYDQLAKSTKYDLTEVPVIKHKSRDELVEILGFRHIAGIMPWDPELKARFIHDLVKRRGQKADFKLIGRQLGVKSTTIRDNYVAYEIFLQARDNFGIDVTNLESSFSVFFRAVISIQNIQKFIGLDKNQRDLRKLRRPISERKKDALREVIEFVHGTKNPNVAPVLTDSRKLTELGAVLVHEEALDYLRRSRNLDTAYALTGGEQRSLIRGLNDAGFYLDEALRVAHRHKGDPDVAKVVERCMDSLLEILKHFPEVMQKAKSIIAALR